MQLLKRFCRLTNGKTRILVGLMLVGLLALHAVTGHAEKSPDEVAVAMAGRQVGHTSAGVRQRLETLARTDHAALLELCASQCDRYADFTCTFVKQERIHGEVRDEQTIEATFRDDPFSVGMKWVKNPPRGDRVLFLEGQYGGQMLVRPTGFLARKFVPTALRKPDGPDAMKSTLRPVNLFGFRRSIQSLLDVYRLAAERGDLRQEFGGYAKVAGRDTLVLHRYLPRKPDYPAALTKIYIDVDWMTPIMVEGFGWDDHEFLCRYVYRDVKFNVGLTDEDFALDAFGLVDPR